MAHPSKPAYDAILSTPLPGRKLGIRFEQNVLCSIDYVSSRYADKLPVNGHARRVATQLAAYFNNPQRPFSLSLILHGTAFQKRVWHALQNIPSGHTCSYGELARKLRTSARAVGNACRANPISIAVPCHRVLAKHGLGGYSGKTSGAALNIKRWLLDHESSG